MGKKWKKCNKIMRIKNSKKIEKNEKLKNWYEENWKKIKARWKVRKIYNTKIEDEKLRNKKIKKQFK